MSVGIWLGFRFSVSEYNKNLTAEVAEYAEKCREKKCGRPENRVAGLPLSVAARN